MKGSKSKIFLTLAAAVVLAGAYFVLRPVNHSQDAASIDENSIDTSEHRDEITTQQAQDSREGAQGNQPSSAGSVGTLNAPSMDTLRDEVEENPHGTPPALLAFAEKMAVQMEEAELSQDKAKIFFTELEDCVLNQKDKNAVSVQAICLMNAEDLSEVYPDLAGKYQGLRKGASMEVLRMLEGVEAGE